METPVPLSAISFCSTSLHKKDAAAIGANFQTPVLRGKEWKKLTIENSTVSTI